MAASDLLLTPTTTHAQNSLKAAMHKAIKAYRLLIIDEIGYLPMHREQANLFFHVIAALSEKSSLIVTDNLPFGQWDTTFTKDATLTAALLDCLLHHANIGPIAGESYRLEHQRQARVVQSMSDEKIACADKEKRENPARAGDGGVSVVNRCRRQNCTSFQSLLTHDGAQHQCSLPGRRAEPSAMCRPSDQGS